MMRCFIVSPGPSFNPSDLDWMCKAGDIYTVNRALRAYNERDDYPDGSYFLDMPCNFGPEKPSLLNAKVVKFVRWEHKEHWGGYPNAIPVRCNWTTTKNFDPFKVKKMTGPKLTAMFAWLHLMRSDNYDQIVLVGWDLRTYGERSSLYYTKDKNAILENTRKRRIASYSCVYRTMRKWKRYADLTRTETVIYGPSKLKDSYRVVEREEIDNGV